MSSPQFRPESIAAPVHGETAAASGAHLAMHGAESQLTSSAMDVGRAHQFFAPGAEAHALAAHMSMPVLPHALEGGLATAIAGAAEQISPMIQMIMRMPGHIGLFNSFFEAIGNFFFNNLHALGIDPSILDLHAHVAALSAHLPSAEHLIPSEHFTIDPSLLPEDAPILHTQMGHSLTSFDGMPRGSLMHHSEWLNSRDVYNVSAQANASNPQFEVTSGDRAGELVSGPSMSETPVGNHLASGERVFSDRFQGSMFSKPVHGALMSGSGLAQSIPLNGTPQVPSSFNVSAPTFGAQPQALSAVAQPGDMTSTAAPAGATMESAGAAASGSELSRGSILNAAPSEAFNLQNAGQHLIASGNPADAFRPHMGADSSAASGTGSSVAHATTGGGEHLTGMKAKALTLDSVKAGGQPHSALPTSQAAVPKVAHQVAHQVAHNTSSSHHADATAGGANKHGNLLDKPAQTAHHTSNAHLANNHDLLRNSGHKDLIAKATPKDVAAASQQTTTSDAATVGSAQSSSYTIRAGDCLWNIARNHMGSGFKWHDLYQMNHDVLGSNPSLLHSGTNLKLPGMHNEIASAGNNGSYFVKSGDNLWNIARDQMHDATKWGDIYKVNTDVIGANPRMIMPGQELAMPRGSLLASGPAPTAALEHVAQAAPAAHASQTLSSAAGEPMHVAHAIHHVVPSDASQSIASTAPAHSLIQKVLPPSGAGQPVSMAPSAPSVHVGPGAASAATLRFPQALPPVQPGVGMMHPTFHPVVDGAVRSNLASFISQK